MKQIVINYITIVVFPIIIGLSFRIILQRFSKAFLATIAFAVLTVIGWTVVLTVPSHGSETYGLLALQATIAFLTSLLTGLILRLKSKKQNKENKELE